MYKRKRYKICLRSRLRFVYGSIYMFFYARSKIRPYVAWFAQNKVSFSSQTYT